MKRKNRKASTDFGEFASDIASTILAIGSELCIFSFGQEIISQLCELANIFLETNQQMCAYPKMVPVIAKIVYELQKSKEEEKMEWAHSLFEKAQSRVPEKHGHLLDSLIKELKKS